MFTKTHKATRKALKQGIKVSLLFNTTEGQTLIIRCHDSITGKLLSSWGREPKEQTDRLLAMAIKKMVKDIKKTTIRTRVSGNSLDLEEKLILSATLGFYLAYKSREAIEQYLRTKSGKK